MFAHTHETQSSLDDVLDSINRAHGAGTVRPGVVHAQGIATRRQYRSPAYATQWSDICTVKAI
ncbi:MAG: DUF4113 domain-containing protein [Candidatus Pacebacteria bacterium]|nr:DUF4113 domain-containing protein [Candidatus Paceibacterota bacterium]